MPAAKGASPALLIGRAADAEILLRGIESGAVKQLWPVGVLSPSASDRGQTIRNIPVLGGIDDVEDVIRDFERRGKPIARVVMTPSAFEPEARPEAVLMRARRLGLIVSRLPSLESGDAPRLTAVAVEDLLLRPSEKIDYARLEALVKNKSVIVTGGGGSIGSEICDRVATFGAARLLVIENSEPALYAVTEALAAHDTSAAIEGRIADIRDRERIMRLMSEFKPDIVFHAAALKHVPILERDWSEGVKTNIFGSVNVADAALAAGAEAMVMISTDKAIEPVSMLGLTKRFAEMYCQALDHDLATQVGGKPRMRLISVRFGNVLASNGSVVPKFKAQIEAGGPVTVTHPDMVRYFMTIREACDLVITAATHALAPVRPDVSVYVLNMGQPVKIVDLAERMIRLSGLEPGLDIEIVFTGMRPGERLNEILFASEEPTVEIGVAGIMAAKPNEPPMATLAQMAGGARGGDRKGRPCHHQGRAEGCGSRIRRGGSGGRSRAKHPSAKILSQSVFSEAGKNPARKRRKNAGVDDGRIQMLPARAQAFQVAADGDAEAAGRDAADLEVGDHARQIAHAEIVQRQRAQHVVVVGGGDVAQIVFADLLRHFPSHVEGGVRRHPAELKRVAAERPAAPHPRHPLGAVIGHHVEVAIDDIGILAARRRYRQARSHRGTYRRN